MGTFVYGFLFKCKIIKIWFRIIWFNTFKCFQYIFKDFTFTFKLLLNCRPTRACCIFMFSMPSRDNWTNFIPNHLSQWLIWSFIMYNIFLHELFLKIIKLFCACCPRICICNFHYLRIKCIREFELDLFQATSTCWMCYN